MNAYDSEPRARLADDDAPSGDGGDVCAHATSGYNLADAVHDRFSAMGGFEFPEIPREPIREPPVFEA